LQGTDVLFASRSGKPNLAPPFLKTPCSLLVEVVDASRAGNTLSIIA
jgi:hypothetical protein